MKSKNINQVKPLSSFMDMRGLLEKLEGEKIKLDFHLGGRKLIEVTVVDKNIDMQILDSEGLKELIKKVRG
jgi:hypothetical protein